MREKADKYGFNKNKIGLIGFSAGAHLSATSCVLSDEKPDFALLIYGYFGPSEAPENTSGKKLTLDNMTKKDFETMNIISLVSSETPPTFLAHSMDDEVCPFEGTIQYATALEASKVPVEVHLFPTGKHGYGLGRGEDGTDQWLNLAVSWVKRL